MKNIDLNLLSPIMAENKELIPLYSNKYAEGIFYASMKWMESQEDFSKFWQETESSQDTIELKGFYIEDGKIIEDDTSVCSWIFGDYDCYEFVGLCPYEFMREPICASEWRGFYLYRNKAKSQLPEIVNTLNRFCFMRENWDGKVVNSFGPYFLLQKVGGDDGCYVLYGPDEAKSFFDTFTKDVSEYMPLEKASKFRIVGESEAMSFSAIVKKAVNMYWDGVYVINNLEYDLPLCVKNGINLLVSEDDYHALTNKSDYYSRPVIRTGCGQKYYLLKRYKDEDKKFILSDFACELNIRIEIAG